MKYINYILLFTHVNFLQRFSPTNPLYFMPTNTLPGKTMWKDMFIQVLKEKR